MLRKARDCAKKCHAGQKRKFSGKPYIVHPLNVALTVLDMGGTKDMACAAVLHDVVEDCGVRYIDIAKKFNENIAYLVWELTNDKEEIKKWRSKGDYLGMKMRNMSEEAITIKLADRLDNVIDLKDPRTPFSFKKKYYRETREILSTINGCLKLNQHTVLVDLIKAYLDYYSVQDERFEC